ncbi:MAG: hypothetical protein QOC87_20 [Actinomycetota bacterium]|nr:hypothetical protein [Actinomycetota bacterium]
MTQTLSIKATFAGLLAFVLVLGLIDTVAAGPPAGPPPMSEEAILHSHGPDGPGVDLNPHAGPNFDPSATWSPSDYDGQIWTKDAPDITDPSILPSVHAIYLYPSDAASRFLQLAPMMQASARRASSLMKAFTGHEIRFDERYGADSATRYLDITVVKSSYDTRKLGSSSQFSWVTKQLSSSGFTNPNKKYLVWLDAPSQYCGQSSLQQATQRNASNPNNARSVSAIYRYYDPSNSAGGFCGAVLHELSHAMGAVQSVAPHYQTSHCNDNANDVMCYYASTIPYSASAGLYYDYGDNDYLDPSADATNPGLTGKLPWWTVNLSRFLCGTAGCEYPNTPSY